MAEPARYEETRTLDEILDECGVTREEWQRARHVVEDYWRDFATWQGWKPTDEPAAIRERRRVAFPIAPGEFIEAVYPHPLTEREWETLTQLAHAMKIGLVGG